MSPGGGELSLSVCPGVGNRTSSTQMPGGVPRGGGGGGVVTGRIEPRIIYVYADENWYPVDLMSNNNIIIISKKALKTLHAVAK